MKIEKLKTLRQFIESLIPKINESTERVIYKGLCLDAIMRYNSTMHWDIVEHMIWSGHKNIAECEEKVIFKGVKKGKYPNSYDLSVHYNIGFTGSGVYITDNRTNKETVIKTLYDISVATNGELFMQNLDI